MKHRYVVNLYSEDPLDAEIADYLVIHQGSRRQELLRTLVKIGFSTLIKGKDSLDAVSAGMDKTELVLLLRAMLAGDSNFHAGNRHMPQAQDYFPRQHQQNHGYVAHGGQNHHDGSVTHGRDAGETAGKSDQAVQDSSRYRGSDYIKTDGAGREFTTDDVIDSEMSPDSLDPIEDPLAALIKFY